MAVQASLARRDGFLLVVRVLKRTATFIGSLRDQHTFITGFHDGPAPNKLGELREFRYYIRMLAALFAALLFSISVVSGNRSSQCLGANAANFWRLVIATALLACWAHAFGKGLEGPAFPIFFVSGCIGFGFGDLAMFQALPRLGSRRTILMVQCFAAPIGAITEWIWMGTQLSFREIMGGTIILAGVALALRPSRSQSVEPENGRAHLISGAIFGLLAAAGQAWGAVLSRRGFASSAAHGFQLDGISSAYQRIIGGLLVGGLFFGIVWWRRRAHNGGLARSERCRAGRWVLLNSLSGPALGVSCYQWALRTTPTGVVLPIVATTPLLVIPFAWFMEGDRPTWKSVIGGALAVLGVILLA